MNREEAVKAYEQALREDREAVREFNRQQDIFAEAQKRQELAARAARAAWHVLRDALLADPQPESEGVDTITTTVTITTEDDFVIRLRDNRDGIRDEIARIVRESVSA